MKNILDRLIGYKRQIGVCLVLMQYIAGLFPNSELGSNLQMSINYLHRSESDLDSMIAVLKMDRDSAIAGAGLLP